MSSNPSARKASRGGGGRGRGRGGGGRRSGRGRSNKRSDKASSGPGGNQSSNNASTSNNNNGSSQSTSSQNLLMRDEEVLIAFMPFLKSDNQEAMSIHEMYQSSQDQPAFLRAARDFLARENHKGQATPIKNASKPPQAEFRPRQTPSRSPPPDHQPPAVTTPLPDNPFSNINDPLTIHNSHNRQISNHENSPFHNMVDLASAEDEDDTSPIMQSLEEKMNSLMDDDPEVSMPVPFQNNPISAIGPGFGFGPPPPSRPPQYMFPPQISAPLAVIQNNPHQQNPFPFQHQHQQPPNLPPITPPRNVIPGSSMQDHSLSASPFSILFPSGGSSPFAPRMAPPPHPYAPPPPGVAVNWSHAPPPNGLPNTNARISPVPPPSASIQPNRSAPSPVPPIGMNIPNNTVMDTTTSTDTATDAKSTDSNSNNYYNNGNGITDAIGDANSKANAAKKEYQPKRLWTRLDEQPGKILANNVAPSMGTVVDLRPREELTAQWMLPLSYLREKAAADAAAADSSSGNEGGDPLRNVLKNLAVGLFRRGCTENGSQASIVSKEILSPPGESRNDYPYKIVNDTVMGTVPFYSPRTPGHVVFRMYWQNDPLNTLATGPTLNVRVAENDFEHSIRFILSNFKAKKVNPTSLSSLNSFALVLEQFQVSPNKNQQAVQQQLEGAGRAIWGCICEARKVLDACSSEYVKTTAKLQKLEEDVEGLKAVVDEEEKDNSGGDESTKDSNESREETPHMSELKEKQKSLMSGRASCERKWRDSQLAFSSILKAIVTNPSMTLLLKRELISKLRLEYELWCPLCEEFAVPSDSADVKMWYEPLSNLPHSLSPEHFRFCTDARSKMQVRILGFDPNTTRLENILYPNRRNRQMNPAAVNVFNQLSSAMGQLYQEVYSTEDRIHQQREMIRMQTEQFVNMCDCFPPGTKVAIFGSSANGFGSPKSDLDMCLQLPPGASIEDKDDPSGSKAMGELAAMLEKKSMKDVDISRLTARIPVIKFNFPKKPENGTSGEEEYIECDLSMHNPLAVLNTALLRTYSDINPVARVLAGVVKRWAKARDINNPARHTLSSYGYILMLLHFLTFHQRSGNGLVVPLNRSGGKDGRSQGVPLLPNLQWMDEKWPEQAQGTPYMEYTVRPSKLMQHPLEQKSVVNTHFYRPSGPLLHNLQRLFPGQDLSLGILLASFFRYYAYEFDYKRHVVSLHSTFSHGLIEREVKAELDGWRNYSAALTIEDPFETFYDVAHVLRGGYYHRIRREFAVAYSKIADIAMGKTNSNWGNGVDLSTMDGRQLIDWICEPVANEREEQQQLAS